VQKYKFFLLQNSLLFFLYWPTLFTGGEWDLRLTNCMMRFP